RPASWTGPVVAVVASAILLVLVVAASQVFLRPATLDGLLPRVRDGIGFWTAFAAISLSAVGALALTALTGMRRAAGAGFLVLAVVEAAVFTLPYNSKVPNQDVPPPSRVMAWLHDHSGGRTVAFVDVFL